MSEGLNDGQPPEDDSVSLGATGESEMIVAMPEGVSEIMAAINQRRRDARRTATQDRLTTMQLLVAGCISLEDAGSDFFAVQDGVGMRLEDGSMATIPTFQ